MYFFLILHILQSNSWFKTDHFYLKLTYTHALQVNWDIVGPNSQDALPPQNRDFADPVSGAFYFGEGEGGVRTIILTVHPHEEIEVEETFVIKLTLAKGQAKLDSRANAVTLTVSLIFLFTHRIFNGVIRKCIYIC